MAISGKDGDDNDDDGGRGDDDADVNFLSSINVCLVMCSDVLLMQNWDHVNTVLNSLNPQPRNVADVNFSLE
jgi:U3 small nucleolar RNA-associated protein 25